MIEKGRHHGMLREDGICKQCDFGCVEDEFHFLLVCLNTRIYVNSICLNITLITRTLLIFSTPKMAKYLEICLFISTKALKYVMVLGKAIKIYHWASQRGWWACVRGLALGWPHGRGLCSFGRGSAVWTLAPHFRSRLYLSGSRELGCRGLGWLSLTCGHGLLGVLDTVAWLCNGSLLTSVGNPIRLSRLRETIIQADNVSAIL